MALKVCLGLTGGLGAVSCSFQGSQLFWVSKIGMLLSKRLMLVHSASGVGFRGGQGQVEDAASSPGWIQCRLRHGLANVWGAL